MTIKLNGSTAGSVALDAPASTTGSADIQFKLPVADGTAGQVLQTDGSGNLSWVTPGITMFQRWVFTSPISFGSSWSTVSTNLSARSTSIGSSMTQSSGVFTFPSTGIYDVSFYGVWLDQSASNDYLGQQVQYSTDSGSNWTDGVQGWQHTETNDYASQTVSYIFDVTNVSTHKIRFRAQSQGNGGAFIFGSNSTTDLNYLQFLRLGDT